MHYCTVLIELNNLLIFLLQFIVITFKYLYYNNVSIINYCNFNQYSLINILTYTNTRYFENTRLIHEQNS